MTVAASRLDARSLSDELHAFIDREAFPERRRFIDPVGLFLERLATRGTDFPVATTAPGFAYRYDFDTGVWTRASESFGPVFAERSETVGRQKLDLGLSYLHADLTELDGRSLATRVRFAGTVHAGVIDITAGLVFQDFTLTSDVVSASATYGVTDDWDVNLLVPVVRTALHASGLGAAAIDLPGLGRGAALTEAVSFDEDAVGVGDILVRTKYRWHETPTVKIAASFVLRVPSGREEDFQGLGDPTVTPGLIVSRPLGRHDLHASLGTELDGDSVARSRARYALGATVQPWTRAAFLVDFLGSSAFVDDHFELRAPGGGPVRGKLATQRDFGLNDLIDVHRDTVVATVPRTDVVDLALGIKVQISDTAIAFASAIVPLTRDGLRADVIPAAGIEVTF